MYLSIIDNISNKARKRKKTTVVDLLDNLGRENTIRQSVLSNIPGPISTRKYVELINLKYK
jgi:hypothetical protein